MIVVQMIQEYDYLFHAFYNVYHGICLYFINYIIHYYTFKSHSQRFYSRTSHPSSLSLVWWKFFTSKWKYRTAFCEQRVRVSLIKPTKLIPHTKKSNIFTPLPHLPTHGNTIFAESIRISRMTKNYNYSELCSQV